MSGTGQFPGPRALSGGGRSAHGWNRAGEFLLLPGIELPGLPMVPARKTPAYRRLRLEQLIAKIEQIEQQAALTLHEFPHGHTVERQRLIMAIAKQVRSHLMDQVEAGEREPLLVTST